MHMPRSLLEGSFVLVLVTHQLGLRRIFTELGIWTSSHDRRGLHLLR